MGVGNQRKIAWSVRALPMVTTLIGTLVFVVGLLQLAAAIAAAPGDPIVAALGDNGNVSESALERLVDSRQAANAWTDSPRHYRDIGRAARILAWRAGDDRVRADFIFRLSAEATENGLRLAPIDPASWLRLAAIRLDVDADPVAALAALRAAAQSGPYDPYRTEPRIRMILRLWPVLDESDRLLFQPQFKYLWTDDPEALIRLALNDGAYLITLAMLDDAESADELTDRRNDFLRSPQ